MPSLNIKRKKPAHVVQTFKQLKAGKTFSYRLYDIDHVIYQGNYEPDDTVYMKLSQDDEAASLNDKDTDPRFFQGRAVNLHTGKVKLVFDVTKVIPLKAKLTVETVKKAEIEL